MEVTLVIKKVVLAILMLWLLTFAFSEIISYSIRSNTPDFIENMEEEAMNSTFVRAKIGKQVRFETNYNKNDLNADTIKFKVEIKGSDKQLLMMGYALKKGGDWVPVKIDSTYQVN